MTKLAIKSQPEDFVVEEISRLQVQKKGPFGAYVLTKRNWNTVELLGLLAKRLKIHPWKIAYGGKKDRYGATSQPLPSRAPGRKRSKSRIFP